MIAVSLGWAWLAWVAVTLIAFAAIETYAIRTRRKGAPARRDTATSYFQWLTDAKGRSWRRTLALAVLVGFAAWLVAHFFL